MISPPLAPSFTGVEREPCDPSPTELGGAAGGEPPAAGDLIESSFAAMKD